MKNSLLAFLIMGFCGAAYAAPQAVQTNPHADKIFQATVEDPVIKQRIKNEIAHAINKNISKMPCASYLKPEVQQFADKVVETKLKPMVTGILIQEFSNKELQDIEAFITSPTGKKIVAKVPEIADRSDKIAMQAALENAGEIATILSRHVNSDGTCK